MVFLKSCVAFQSFLVNDFPCFYFGETHCGDDSIPSLKFLNPDNGRGWLITDFISEFNGRCLLLAEGADFKHVKDSIKFSGGALSDQCDASSLEDIRKFRKIRKNENLKIVCADVLSIFSDYTGNENEWEYLDEFSKILNRWFQLYQYVFFDTGDFDDLMDEITRVIEANEEVDASDKELAVKSIETVLLSMKKILNELPRQVSDSLRNLYSKIQQEGVNVYKQYTDRKNDYEFEFETIPPLHENVTGFFEPAMHYIKYMREFNMILYFLKSLFKNRYDCYLFWYGSLHIESFGFFMNHLAKTTSLITFSPIDEGINVGRLLGTLEERLIDSDAILAKINKTMKIAANLRDKRISRAHK